jgi:glycosyltransferase involved in cell wall biosynthesis
MKILIWIPYRTSLAPSRHHLLPLLCKMSQRGHEITIITSLRDYEINRLTFKGPLPSEGGSIISRIRHAFSELLKQINNEYDIVICSKALPSSLGTLYSFYKLKMLPPLVLHVDDYEVDFVKSRTNIPLLPLIYKFIMYNAKSINLTIAASFGLFQLYKRITKNVVYLPCSTNLDVFNPYTYKEHQRSSEIPKFMWCGSIDEHFENLMLLFHAVRLSKSKFKVIIIGGGKKLVELRKVVSILGISGKVEFKGKVEHEVLPQVLSEGDFAVLPLTRTLLNSCKAPIKLFEYMAMCLPIIATDVGEPAYMIRKIGNGIVVKDSNEMAKAMDNFVYEEKYWKAKGILGRKYLEEKQNWNVLSKCLEDLLSNLLQDQAWKR